jgi:hypothetical protein
VKVREKTQRSPAKPTRARKLLNRKAVTALQSRDQRRESGKNLTSRKKLTARDKNPPEAEPIVEQEENIMTPARDVFACRYLDALKMLY